MSPQRPEPFPQLLYVYQSYESPPHAPFDGRVDYSSAEEGDDIAIYELVKICRVKEKREKYLEEVPK